MGDLGPAGDAPSRLGAARACWRPRSRADRRGARGLGRGGRGGTAGVARRARAGVIGAVLRARSAAGRRRRIAARARPSRHEPRERLADRGPARGRSDREAGTADRGARRRTGLDDLDDYYAGPAGPRRRRRSFPLVVGARILFADWVSAVVIALTLPLVPVFMVLIGLHTRSASRRGHAPPCAARRPPASSSRAVSRAGRARPARDSATLCEASPTSYARRPWRPCAPPSSPRSRSS